MLFAQQLSRSTAIDFETILILMVLGATGIAIGIPAILATQWRAVRERQLASALIEQMLAHGMTADDIERVLLAWWANPDEIAKLWRQRRKEEKHAFPAKPSPKVQATQAEGEYWQAH